LALATLCDFLFETPTLVNREVVEQIEQLHSLMNVKDMPLEKLVSEHDPPHLRV